MSGVPNTQVSINKVARERKGFGYNSASNVTSPIYMSDISRLSGGNSSGSGTSYPAVNTLNPANERPDGANPLAMGEFIGYEQNLTLVAFYYVYSSSDSSSACSAAIPDGPYYHNDGNNLYPDDLTGIYTAYTNSAGTNAAPSGYYAIYDSFFNSTGKYIYVGNNGSITGGGSC